MIHATYAKCIKVYFTYLHNMLYARTQMKLLKLFFMTRILFSRDARKKNRKSIPTCNFYLVSIGNIVPDIFATINTMVPIVTHVPRLRFTLFFGTCNCSV